MSVWLVAQAWTELLWVDLTLGLRGFRAVERVVRRVRLRPSPSGEPTLGTIVGAVQTAGVLYVRPTRCLQRAAVVTRLLRRRGIPADLVIGCQRLPLKAHAWVEVAGEVVSDELDGLEHYKVLDRW